MIYIKEVIKRHGITQVELAEKLGCNRVSLNSTLNNPNIKLSTLERIAAAIGCSVAEFFEDERAEAPGLVCPKCGTKLKLVEDND